jgi:hypothetical protein
MTINLKSNSSGTEGSIQVNGVDAVVFNSTGIITGSNAIGHGQTFQNVTGSRALNSDYTNNTGRTIQVSASCSSTAPAFVAYRINGVTFAQNSVPGGGYAVGVTFLVPPGATYAVYIQNGTLSHWYEVR